MNEIVNAGLLTGLLEVIKQLGMPSKYCPLLAVVLGAILCVAQQGFGMEIILKGMAVGLSSVGLYSFGTTYGTHNDENI